MTGATGRATYGKPRYSEKFKKRYVVKVIFVNGSSHANGTTMQAVKEMQNVENPFAFKPGASIAVARRGGTTA